MVDDLLHHYKVLKQFLDISNDSENPRKNASSRAAKARDKLLKLSSAQFRELSTDVYDELRRRIDELRSEPDFLLPKLNFHPKRNQARQKLSSLPQSRFRDLVSDISYEIERRHLHQPVSASSTPTSTMPSKGHAPLGSISSSVTRSVAMPVSADSDKATSPQSMSFPSTSGAGPLNSINNTTHNRLSDYSGESHGHGGEKFDKQMESPSQSPVIAYAAARQLGTMSDNNESRQLSRMSDNALSDDALHREIATPNINASSKQAISLLSTKVVPTKANMTWSSDEEEEGNFEQDFKQELLPSIEEPRRLLLSNAFVMNKNKAPPRIASLGSPEQAVSRVDDLEILKEKYNALELENIDLKTIIEDLKSKVFVLEGEKEAFSLEKKSMFTGEQYSDLQDELDSLRSANAALRLENQNMKTKMSRDSKASTATQSPSLPSPLLHTAAVASMAAVAGAATGAVASAVTSVSSGATASTSSEPSAKSIAPVDVNTELRNFYEKLEQIAVKPSNTQTTLKEEILRNEALMWQKKFESVQAKERMLSFKTPATDLHSYVSPSGLISLKWAVKFFTLVESFVESVSRDRPDTDLLFENISMIALTANKICGDTSSLNTPQTDAVREAASHALTATRYYATYSNLMPRVIVERAVGEIAFSVCDLISVSKLLSDNNLILNESSFMSQNDTTHFNNQPKLDAVRTLKIAPKFAHKSVDYINDNSNTRPVLEGLKKTSLQGKPDDYISANSSIRTALEGSQKTSLPEKADDNKNDTSSTRTVSEGSMETSQQEKSTKARVAPSQNETTTSSPIDSSRVADGKEKSGTPITKPSILEKVKQFEQRENNMQDTKHTRNLSHASSFSNKSRFSDDFVHSEPLEKKLSEQDDVSIKTTDDTPTRSKSIFQSLRERFTGDGSSAGDKKSDDAAKHKRKDLKTSLKSCETKESESADTKIQSIEPMSDTSKTEALHPEVKEELPQVNSKSKFGQEEMFGKAIPETVSIPALGIEIPSTSELEVPKGTLGSRATQSEDDSIPSDASSGISSAVRSAVRSVEQPQETTTSKVLPISDDGIYKNTQPAQLEAPLVLAGLETSDEKSQAIKQVEPTKEEPATKFSSMSKDILAPSKLEAKPEQATFAQPRDYEDKEESEYEEDDEEDEEEEEDEARQRQDYRKSMAAATFNIDLFDIEDPDNTLTHLLLYLEHQTVQVISTIQDLLSAIKKPDVSRGELRGNSSAISEVIRQMTEATNNSMNQTRNHQLKEHGSWVVRSLEDCDHRMNTLCKPTAEKADLEFADRHFKQRLAGISFDIAKCTKELVKTVEEASLKEDIAQLDARINQVDLT